MTSPIYVWSGAAGTGAGTSWTNACTTIAAGITAGGAAGVTYYIAHDHSEAAAVNLSFAGTPTAPDVVLCVDRTGTVPPVSADLRTTASISGVGVVSFGVSGSVCVYIYGVNFAAATRITASGTLVRLDSCTLQKTGVSATATAIVNNATGIELNNTTVQFGATGDSFTTGPYLKWTNTTSAVAGATLPTTLLTMSSSANFSTVALDGVDLSALGSGKTLVSTAGLGRVSLVNCKLGASVAVGTPTKLTTVVEMQISDSGSGQYRQERYLISGTLTAETTVVPAAQQASDGTTPITWKVITASSASRAFPFETFAYVEWNDTTGSALTRTFEVVNDATTLTNADVWPEVEYLGSASTPLSSKLSGGVADVLAVGSNLTTSTATWTTTGIVTPVKQKMAVTFTPQMKGYFRITFRVAKASKTLWINPRPNEV